MQSDILSITKTDLVSLFASLFQVGDCRRLVSRFLVSLRELRQARRNELSVVLSLRVALIQFFGETETFLCDSAGRLRAIGRLVDLSEVVTHYP